MYFSSLIPADVDTYCQQYTKKEHPLLAHLIQETYAYMELPHMLIGRIESQLLKLLVRLSQAKTIFEVGTFTGYSALSMAEALPVDGHITTCEVDKRAEQIARKYFQLSPYGYKIDLVMGPGIHTLTHFQRPIDLAFVDADKITYPDYLKLLTDKVRTGGLMIFDNTLLSGSVLNPEKPSSQAVHRTNQLIQENPNLDNFLLPVQDGIQIIQKVGS